MAGDLGPWLVTAWRRLSPLPGGRWLFSRLVGRMAPYSDSMRARVLELEPGRARLELRDRRRVRNHLRSIHAVALLNLGELTSGLAMMAALPAGVRGIVTRIEAEYLKKARGRLTADASPGVPPRPAPESEHEARSEIRDEEGDVVARVTVTWRLGLVPAEEGAGD